MTLFWAICALLLIVALLFVVLPLWRNTSNRNDVLRDEANLEILRDQSAELESDLHNGLLTQEGYEQGMRELRARLLEEVNTTGQPVKPQHSPARVLAMVLAVLLPLSSVLLYQKIGNPDALLYADRPANLSPEAVLQELERKAKRQPDDPDNLVTLARAYSELRRFADAERTYEQLVKLVPDIAQVWAEYADVYAMTHNRSLQGEPDKFLGKALELDGSNLLALNLSGAAAMQRGDYFAAITRWQSMIGLLPPDAEYAQTLRDNIHYARGMLAKQKGGREKLAKLPAVKTPKRAAGGTESISGKVALSAALAGKAASDDAIYIIAREQGQKMPLAVLRKQVKDLPLQFTLDDSMAMQPQVKLSGSSRVTVVARISRTGNPVAQPGDLQGSTGDIKPGSKGVNIVIDSVVP